MSHQKDKVTRIMKDPLSADAVDKTGNISQQEILLDAVFWDYPKFRDETFLRDYLERNRDNSGYRWVLARFLERGRVVDTLKFFTIQEIPKEALPHSPLLHQRMHVAVTDTEQLGTPADRDLAFLKRLSDQAGASDNPKVQFFQALGLFPESAGLRKKTLVPSQIRVPVLDVQGRAILDDPVQHGPVADTKDPFDPEKPLDLGKP